ncbi:MAG: 4Fe-4S binding protein [Candidatus Omnitrophica bacterium]|nr:4Fe-4S binding protein [Candidatus Omnitrophota bacterium]
MLDLIVKRRTRQFLSGLIFIAILVSGWYYPLLGYFIPLCMLLGIGIGVLRGRKWCDWYCPRGSFYDGLISPISPQKRIPFLLRSIYFRIAFLSILMSLMAFNLFRRWPNPYKMGMFFVIMITATTLLGIILALIFHQRSWCLICPIGTAVNLIGRNRYPLKIDSDLCVECKLCVKVCPVQLKPYLFKDKGIRIVKDNDCLKCGLCISVCPLKALSF